MPEENKETTAAVDLGITEKEATKASTEKTSELEKATKEVEGEIKEEQTPVAPDRFKIPEKVLDRYPVLKAKGLDGIDALVLEYEKSVKELSGRSSLKGVKDTADIVASMKKYSDINEETDYGTDLSDKKDFVKTMKDNGIHPTIANNIYKALEESNSKQTTGSLAKLKNQVAKEFNDIKALEDNLSRVFAKTDMSWADFAKEAGATAFNPKLLKLLNNYGQSLAESSPELVDNSTDEGLGININDISALESKLDNLIASPDYSDSKRIGHHKVKGDIDKIIRIKQKLLDQGRRRR